jgi:hypothetical protein
MRLRPPAVGAVLVPKPLPETIAQADAAEALKVITDVWKNEETRFSNLNTRGVAVVSAASLVTTLLGIFTKNILDSTASSLRGDPRTVALIAVSAALGLLILAIGFIVFGVLLPSRRVIFGDNDITAGEDLTAQHIDVVAFREYSATYADLAGRSDRKAYWLGLAYCVFLLALMVSAAATAYVTFKFSIPPAVPS